MPPDPRPGAGKSAPPKIKILVAEDDAVSRELICARLAAWGYEVIATDNGAEAMSELRKSDPPPVAILDWMMPGMDGLEICRRVRQVHRTVYLILLTARNSKAHIAEGLNAGADDYLSKPCDKFELEARIRTGLRIVGLQAALVDRVRELEASSVQIRELKLLIPV